MFWYTSTTFAPRSTSWHQGRLPYAKVTFLAPKETHEVVLTQQICPCVKEACDIIRVHLHYP